MSHESDLAVIRAMMDDEVHAYRRGHRRGQEDMRERAAMVASEYSDAVIYAAIRALPIKDAPADAIPSTQRERGRQ